MELRRDVFQAIADPTRRDIIELLSNQTLNLNAVAGHFEISRPAVSKHIRILTECEIILIKKEGRERFCTADINRLREIDNWLDQYRKFWNHKLDALSKFLDNTDEK